MLKASFKISVIFIALLHKCVVSLAQDYDPNEVSISDFAQEIGDITVEIAQYKPIDYIKSKFYCSADIKIFKNETLIDSIVFNEIEPVGGHFGLLVYPNVIMNHLIITKYGDYDGRTIIINDQGQIYSTIGGYVFVDYENGYLFSSYDSDYTGISVFDLKNDVELLKIIDIESRPFEFYKAYGNRYFFQAKHDESDGLSIWEIELSMKRIMQVDLTIDKFRNNKLERLADYKSLQINCD